jgi:hypothetical protein
MTFPEQNHTKTYSEIYIVPRAQYAANLIRVQVDWQL